MLWIWILSWIWNLTIFLDAESVLDFQINARIQIGPSFQEKVAISIAICKDGPRSVSGLMHVHCTFGQYPGIFAKCFQSDTKHRLMIKGTIGTKQLCETRSGNVCFWGSRI